MGSVRAVTNSAAAEQWTNEWEPYGLPRTSTQDDPNAAVNPIGWTGQYADPTGSIHLRARQYDPALGRFTAPDQAAAMPYSATGTYAAGNPLAFADPTGLWPSPGDVWNAVASGAAVVAPIAGMAAPFSGPLAPIVGGVAIAAGAITAIDSAYNAYQVCGGNEKGSCAGEIAAGALGIAMGGTGAAAMRAGLAARRVARSETELVQRWMSRAELDATLNTGLVRGGRDGTHYVTDFANHSAQRARQRLALPQTPEVRVQLEVPRGAFSPPKRVDPAFGMPGGGMERTASGPVACRVRCVW
jgi:RHS repeat-associated protein